MERGREVFEYLKNLPEEDLSKEKINEKEIRGEYRRIDLWRRK